jgi:hypothetical protein
MRTLYLGKVSRITVFLYNNNLYEEKYDCQWVNNWRVNKKRTALFTGRAFYSVND